MVTGTVSSLFSRAECLIDLQLKVTGRMLLVQRRALQENGKDNVLHLFILVAS